MIGYIKSIFVDKKFGFIRTNDGDYFFHRSACQDFEGLAYLFNSGDKIEVEFELDEDRGKGPRARDVRVL